MVQLKEIENRWNRVISNLIDCQENFDKFRELRQEGLPLEELTIKGQELLTMATVESEFTVFIERMTRFAYINGGLEYLLIKEPTTDNFVETRSGSTNDPVSETEKEENEDE